MRKLIFGGMLLLVVLGLWGFSPAPDANFSDEWVLAKAADNVSFWYQPSQCDGRDYVFLRVENRNDYPVSLIWDDAIKVGESHYSVADISNYKKPPIVVEAGETVVTDCDSRVDLPGFSVSVSLLMGGSRGAPVSQGLIYQVENLEVVKGVTKDALRR